MTRAPVRHNQTKNVQRKCKNCGDPFMARSADVNRGWANFCNKSCKAKKQTHDTGFAGPDATDHLDAVEGAGWDAHKVWRA